MIANPSKKSLGVTKPGCTTYSLKSGITTYEKDIEGYCCGDFRSASQKDRPSPG
jgi:hypothetical protein